ncbi:hypothetical protein [Nannocystis pusilla]|uniref:hypothetical protein n=1 Tax=Nannocystis pusilla TaxID=889268 RepID=UPI003B77CAEC
MGEGEGPQRGVVVVLGLDRQGPVDEADHQAARVALLEVEADAELPQGRGVVAPADQRERVRQVGERPALVVRVGQAREFAQAGGEQRGQELDDRRVRREAAVQRIGQAVAVQVEGGVEVAGADERAVDLDGALEVGDAADVGRGLGRELLEVVADRHERGGAALAREALEGVGADDRVEVVAVAAAIPQQEAAGLEQAQVGVDPAVVGEDFGQAGVRARERAIDVPGVAARAELVVAVLQMRAGARIVVVVGEELLELAQRREGLPGRASQAERGRIGQREHGVDADRRAQGGDPRQQPRGAGRQVLEGGGEDVRAQGCGLAVAVAGEGRGSGVVVRAAGDQAPQQAGVAQLRHGLRGRCDPPGLGMEPERAQEVGDVGGVEALRGGQLDAGHQSVAVAQVAGEDPRGREQPRRARLHQRAQEPAVSWIGAGVQVEGRFGDLVRQARGVESVVGDQGALEAVEHEQERARSQGREHLALERGPVGAHGLRGRHPGRVGGEVTEHEVEGGAALVEAPPHAAGPRGVTEPPLQPRPREGALADATQRSEHPRGLAVREPEVELCEVGCAAGEDAGLEVGVDEVRGGEGRRGGEGLAGGSADVGFVVVQLVVGVIGFFVAVVFVVVFFFVELGFALVGVFLSPRRPPRRPLRRAARAGVARRRRRGRRSRRPGGAGRRGRRRRPRGGPARPRFALSLRTRPQGHVLSAMPRRRRRNAQVRGVDDDDATSGLHRHA